MNNRDLLNYNILYLTDDDQSWESWIDTLSRETSTYDFSTDQTPTKNLTQSLSDISVESNSETDESIESDSEYLQKTPEQLILEDESDTESENKNENEKNNGDAAPAIESNQIILKKDASTQTEPYVLESAFYGTHLRDFSYFNCLATSLDYKKNCELFKNEGKIAEEIKLINAQFDSKVSEEIPSNSSSLISPVTIYNASQMDLPKKHFWHTLGLGEFYAKSKNNFLKANQSLKRNSDQINNLKPQEETKKPGLKKQKFKCAQTFSLFNVLGKTNQKEIEEGKKFLYSKEGQAVLMQIRDKNKLSQ